MGRNYRKLSQTLILKPFLPCEGLRGLRGFGVQNGWEIRPIPRYDTIRPAFAFDAALTQRPAKACLGLAVLASFLPPIGDKRYTVGLPAFPVPKRKGIFLQECPQGIFPCR
jgi:hypothetical protein